MELVLIFYWIMIIMIPFSLYQESWATHITEHRTACPHRCSFCLYHTPCVPMELPCSALYVRDSTKEWSAIVDI